MRFKDWKERRERVLESYGRTGSLHATGRELHIDRKTLRKVLAGTDAPVPVARKPVASKLDPYKPMVRRLVLDEGLTATLVLEEIRKLGFDGGYSVVKRFVRRIRPAPRLRATIRLDHPPGEEGQVDWSPYRVWFGNEEVTVHAFAFVLPFSSWGFLRGAMDEQLDTLMALHDQAFAELGGLPPAMTYDNMTTVGRHAGKDRVELNPRFEVWARECGFEIRLIDPGCPNQHGPVERFFHYFEHNCLPRRRSRFDDLDDFNRHAAWWCNEVANVRIHGGSRERPIDRLARERAFLKPLSSARPEPFQVVSRLVGSDFCVAIQTNRYSVPPRCVGQAATVRVYTRRLEIVVEGDIVARHVLDDGRYQRHILPEHEADFRRATPSARLLEQAFLRLGEQARTFYDGLCRQRGRGAGYHLKRILSLADRHGSGPVTGAMAQAAAFGNYSADAVARVLAGRATPRAASPQAEAPMPPERVRRWLEGLDVEQPDLGDYDRLIDEEGDDDDAS
jgi:transposase